MRFALVKQTMANLGISIIIAFVYSWELTLVLLVWVPVLFILVSAELQVLWRHAIEDKKELEETGMVLAGDLSSDYHYFCNIRLALRSYSQP